MANRAWLALVGVAACGRAPGAAHDVMADAAPPPDAGPPADASSAPDGPPGLPDLQFEADQMQGAWSVTRDIFADAHDCAVLEGCVAMPGERTLLRFDTITSNRGAGDLVMGPPPPPGESNDVFEWSPCHMHHHVRNYAIYELVDAAGHVTTAHKQSFCLEDSENVIVGAPPVGYACTNQGISRGWADVYGRGLPCQWVDITDLPHGTYTLRITVNPLHTIPESDTSNNVFSSTVTF